MDPILAFLLEHWLLSSAFFVVLVLLLLNEWRFRSFGLKMINSQELVGLLNHKKGVVIDTRSNERYEQGHILGAMHIPVEDFAKKQGVLNKFKNKAVILVGETGIDSPKMGKLLQENGFTQLCYLAGGMSGWQSEGMPIEKKKTN